MFRYLAGAAIKPGGWKYRLARDLVMGRPERSAPPVRRAQPRPQYKHLPPPPFNTERRPTMPNAMDPPILATWTRDKEVSVVKGHARDIYPGARVTVLAKNPGFDGSRLSLQVIGEVRDIGPDKYTQEPMRIGYPVR